MSFNDKEIYLKKISLFYWGFYINNMQMFKWFRIGNFSLTKSSTSIVSQKYDFKILYILHIIKYL